MKKRSLLLLVGLLTLGSFAIADIQTPPGSQWNWSRKLSRSLANLAYGWSEYPITWQKNMQSDGSNAAASAFVVDGTARTVVRLGYGLYELVTFPAPTYKGTYRPPYYKKERFNTWAGYQEFPPQVGFTSQAQYCRGQSW
jgi:putative exosortase-associated protein (TIGR04073 family)